MPHDVFISYSSKDKPIADGVCATLEQNGLRCWIAPRDITPGAEWSASIVQALAEARVFVLVLSGSANASSQITREVERAAHNGLPIIPYRIEEVRPTDALEYFLSTPHWLDAFTPPVEQHAQELAAAIKRLLGETPPAPVPGPAPTPPPARPGLPLPALIAGGLAAVLLALAVGILWIGPKPTPSPANPTTAVTPAAAPLQRFVGDWSVAKVSWAPSVSAGYGEATLGELFAAKMNANHTAGAFHLDPSGAFQTIIEVDDAGSVLPLGPTLMFGSQSDGGLAVVKPTRLASGASIGGQPGEQGLVLTGDHRLPEPWVGLADPRAAGTSWEGVAGTWRSSGWPVLPDGQLWSATMTIGPDGGYRLQLLQKVAGTFSAGADGKWNVTVAAPGGASAVTNGSYVFTDASNVTMTQPQGSTTWTRK